jgi:hypothetical protein
LVNFGLPSLPSHSLLQIFNISILVETRLASGEGAIGLEDWGNLLEEENWMTASID